MLKRTMLQLNLAGCDEAIQMYKEAFGATMLCEYRSADGSRIEHAEMDAFGQIIAFSEWDQHKPLSMTMQFCFHFEKGQEAVVRKAYAVLKKNAMIWSVLDDPYDPCDYADCQFALTDKFGVMWCLFC